jgi:hypothetical protein
VISGYNTDVEYDGVVYHVQTEDKGLQTPIILSLVYSGGAILASKRSPYDDLVAGGFDEQVLDERLKRQHKLICAAVHAGRMDDLRRMSDRDSRPLNAVTQLLNTTDVPAAFATEEAPPEPQTLSEVDEEIFEDAELAPESTDDETPLRIALIGRPNLRSGATVSLRLSVTRHAEKRREPARYVPVTIKILGTTFSPQLITTTTDARGKSSVKITLPDFEGGRAAILIQADDDGEKAELRRIILPSS